MHIHKLILFIWVGNNIISNDEINYQCIFRYKKMKTPIEILTDQNPPNINPCRIGVFQPIITDQHLYLITKSGYHVPRSDT
jgi:hypothetical protein